jgi:hypothetical protein
MSDHLLTRSDLAAMTETSSEKSEGYEFQGYEFSGCIVDADKDELQDAVHLLEEAFAIAGTE